MNTIRDLLVLAVLLSGCAIRTHRSGLIDTSSDPRLVLVEQTGRTTRLVTDDFAGELHYLSGCTVQVEGPRLGRRLYVRRWKVTDAGDGSEPYVGVLRRVGARWAIDDWNSGSLIFLQPASVGTLSQHSGQPILIVGYVVGAQEVAIVSWRVLTGPP